MADFYIPFIWFWIALAVIVFFISLRITAPYGRHTRTGWGPMVDNKIGWMIYESPSLFLVIILFYLGDAPKSNVVWIMFSLFCLHYVNRTIIFPLRIKTKGKKVPLGIVFSAFTFNIVNGSLIGYHLGFAQQYKISWMNDPRFLAGILIFAIGMRINWQSDSALIQLRKKDETGYKIPKNGLFEYISCPNHFGEIIEWFGYAVMLWALPALSFAIWTAANLIPRSLDHHGWYKDYFKEYPTKRKAIIPHIL
jgi:hypothetical protein